MRFLNRLNHELLKDDTLTESKQVNSDLLEIVSNIPRDPNEFYKDFGLFTHPKTGKPVEKLASYQTQLWKKGYSYKYRLVIKSNKIA